MNGTSDSQFSKSQFPKAFAFSSKNKDVLRDSSSGGAFSVLAAHIIRLGGVVFGARLDLDGRVVHDKAETMSEIRPLTKSKYAQSKLGNTFTQCKDALQSGRWVFYTGTPCQINALHAFLDMQGIDKERLVSADVVCHGTPKSRIWERYLQEIGYMSGQIIDFRFKRPSWEKYSFRVGNRTWPISEDPYFWLFLNNYSLAESCFSCKCKGENRRSDITLGDFWGINNVDAASYKRLGVSLIIIRRRLNLISDIFGSRLNPVPYAPSIRENSSYYLSVKKPEKYDEFYKMLETITIKEAAAVLGMKVLKHKHWYSDIRWRLAYKTGNPKNYLLRKVPDQKKNGVIGIISDFGYGNFGNKLQNYALKTFIERAFGIKSKNVVLSNRQNVLRHIYRLIRHPKSFFKPKTPFQKRTASIKKASGKYESNLRFHRTLSAEKKLFKFDKIIFGSDQIWNYGYHIGDLAFNLGFLGIDEIPVPLYTYAASIGKETIEDHVRPLFDEGLRHFAKISVRENTAQTLLENEFGINAQLCVDPTLLLDKSEWEQAIASYASRDVPKEPYALLYIFEEEGQKKEIKQKLTKKGLKCIDLFDQNSEYYISNQFDFINLIAHSKEVHTNSFHGIVFSLIFQVPFFEYSRASFAQAKSRIQTLLSYADLRSSNDGQPQFDLVHSSTFSKKKRESINYLTTIFKK